MCISESTKPFGIVAVTKYGSTTAGPSKFFYFDDLPNRRLRADIMTKAQSADAAQAFARAEREKLEG